MCVGSGVVFNVGEKKTRHENCRRASSRAHNDTVSASELSYLISLYATVAAKKAPVLKDLLKDFCCLRHHVPLMNHVWRCMKSRKHIHANHL